jgi:hypothetical protein
MMSLPANGEERPVATNCPSCGTAVGAGDSFCATCGAAVAPAPAGGAAGVVNEPRNLARIAQVVALLGFLLPWITVSCQDRVLAQVSGLDLALGRVTIHNPFTQVSQVHSGAPSATVVIALVLIVAGLALSLHLAPVRAALANMIGSAAAILLIGYEVLVSAGAAVRSQAVQGGENGLERGISEAIKVSTGFGFWLTCLALGAAIFFCWKVRSGAGAAIGAAAAPAARPEPPPEPEVRTNRAGGEPPPA